MIPLFNAYSILYLYTYIICLFLFSNIQKSVSPSFSCIVLYCIQIFSSCREKISTILDKTSTTHTGQQARGMEVYYNVVIMVCERRETPKVAKFFSPTLHPVNLLYLIIEDFTGYNVCQQGRTDLQSHTFLRYLFLFCHFQ